MVTFKELHPILDSMEEWWVSGSEKPHMAIAKYEDSVFLLRCKEKLGKWEIGGRWLERVGDDVQPVWSNGVGWIQSIQQEEGEAIKEGYR